MDFDDRAGWLLLGCILGAALGYFARMLQEIRKDVDVVAHEIHDIKEEVDEIDTIVKEKRERDEVGALRLPQFTQFKWRDVNWQAVVLFVVVAMSVFASFSTQANNNKLEAAVQDIKEGQSADKDQNARLERISQCTLEFTSKTILALNERTTYTPALSQANVDVLQAQADFLNVVFEVPPPGEQAGRKAGATYIAALDKFNAIAAKNSKKTEDFAYPTNQELANCLGVTLPEVETGEKKTQ